MKSLHTGGTSEQNLEHQVKIGHVRRGSESGNEKVYTQSHLQQRTCMIGVARCLVQQKLGIPEGKLRPDRCMQELDDDVSCRPC